MLPLSMGNFALVSASVFSLSYCFLSNRIQKKTGGSFVTSLVIFVARFDNDGARRVSFSDEENDKNFDKRLVLRTQRGSGATCSIRLVMIP